MLLSDCLCQFWWKCCPDVPVLQQNVFMERRFIAWQANLQWLLYLLFYSWTALNQTLGLFVKTVEFRVQSSNWDNFQVCLTGDTVSTQWRNETATTAKPYHNAVYEVATSLYTLRYDVFTHKIINSTFRCLKCWLQLLKMEVCRIPKQAYKIMISMAENEQKCWVTEVKNVLSRNRF